MKASLLTTSYLLKQELLEHLRTKTIKSVHDLWAEMKDYYSDKFITSGGGYASWETYITVKLLLLDNNRYMFDVNLNEL